MFRKIIFNFELFKSGLRLVRIEVTRRSPVILSGYIAKQ